MSILPKLCLAVAFGLNAPVAHAIVLDADADASVEGSRFGNSATGFGTDLGASYDSFGNRSFKTYIRFDLGGFGGEKANAALAMTKSGAFAHNLPFVPYLIYGMNDAAGDDWI